MGKVLIACEESQAVTKEMRALGIEAYSCDILPTSGEHPERHLQQDVLPLLNENWDMLIAFPPCTHIAVSGALYFEKKRKDGRQQQGIDFFMQFVKAKCRRIAIENPVGIMSTIWRKPDQIINPYEYGDLFPKKTYLWLKGLPLLTPTKILDTDKIEYVIKPNGKKMAKWFYDSWHLPDNERSRVRSKTFPGIAKAMATQWGFFVMNLWRK